jgi:hypothetical protein
MPPTDTTAPPPPTAGAPNGSAVASADGSQTFRSYSYDPAQQPQAAAPAASSTKRPAGPPLEFRAGRKMYGLR